MNTRWELADRDIPVIPADASSTAARCSSFPAFRFHACSALWRPCAGAGQPEITRGGGGGGGAADARRLLGRLPAVGDEAFQHTALSLTRAEFWPMTPGVA